MTVLYVPMCIRTYVALYIQDRNEKTDKSKAHQGFTMQISCANLRIISIIAEQEARQLIVV